jgi:hypothetical protein
VKKKYLPLQLFYQPHNQKKKREALDKWRERVGYQEAQAITQKAALRGTEMHYVLEQYINGVGYLNLSKEGAQARLMAHEIVK